MHASNWTSSINATVFRNCSSVSPGNPTMTSPVTLTSPSGNAARMLATMPRYFSRV